MKKIVKKYTEIPLILRILTGLIIGVLFGIFLPQAEFIMVFGEVFVGALKAIAPILVFILVVSSLASAGKGIGKRFSMVIFYYMISTFIAAVCAVIISYVFPVIIPLANTAVEQSAPTGLGEVFRTLLNNMVANPVAALMNANYVGILCWAIIFGLGFKKLASDGTRAMVAEVAGVVSKAVSWIIQLAPFGIMGLVYSAVAESGMVIFVDYGKQNNYNLNC